MSVFARCILIKNAGRIVEMAKKQTVEKAESITVDVRAETIAHT